MSDDYKVWTCSIIVPGDTKLPEKPDQPLRHAVLKAAKDMKLEILFNKSHWEDGTVHHGDEDKVLDALAAEEGEIVEPDTPEIDPDASTDYGDVTHGS